MNVANTVEPLKISQTGADAGYVCPHCGKTEHAPNTVTLAAMREAQDIMTGKIKVEWQHSPATKEELKVQLEKIG